MRLIDGDALMRKLEPIVEAENQIYGKESWGFASKCITAIEDAPTIEPERKWISVSERLPEQYGNYLISINGEDPDIGTINPNDPRGWSLCDANGFYWANDKALNITAWQTLPEPYREEGDQDDPG